MRSSWCWWVVRVQREEPGWWAVAASGIPPHQAASLAGVRRGSCQGGAHRSAPVVREGLLLPCTLLECTLVVLVGEAVRATRGSTATDATASARFS